MKAIPKKVLILIAVVLVAAAGAAAFFLLRGKEESYRRIEVYEIDGSAMLTRSGIGDMDAYAGMLLQSKDAVSVMKESYLALKMDEDKYALLEALSKIHLEAEGNSTDSKTRIYLDEGALVNRLESELSEDSVYEVNTPNSTMAIRGTTFRVAVEYDENGVSHTQLSVFEGKVECRLVHPDGTVDETPVMVDTGTQIEIRGDMEESEYVVLDGKVDYEELKLKVLEFISAAFDADKELSISKEELAELIESKRNTEEPEIPELPEESEEPEEFTVTYQYGGEPFAVMQVQEGGFAKQPQLQPTSDGYWNFDFQTPILSDTSIEWIGRE